MNTARQIAPRLWVIHALLLVTMFFQTVPAMAQSPQPPDLDIQDLGDDRFQVGQIIVDKAAGSFSVPATLLDLGVPDAPLEFLVVTRNGPKSYESLLEIDATAYEFNVACLLIGLNPDNAKLPLGNFQPEPADGDPVALHVSWDDNGEQVTRPATDFIQVTSGEEPTDEWVYLGSFFMQDGQYAADWIGLAVGFVHDVESIIQHASGIGLASYGATVTRPVAGVTTMTPLQLIVSRKDG